MSPPAATYTLAVESDKAGTRLDRFLADHLPDLSRTRLQALITSGNVVGGDGRPAVDPSLRIRQGQVFVIDVPSPPSETPQPQAIHLSVAFEDDHLLVVDKPAGLVVHPGAGNRDGTLVNALLAHTGGRLSSIGAPLRPGIVHRIDKDTSGLLAVAKTDVAHRSLAQQFAEHSIERAYHAIVWGNPIPPAGRIDKRIGRSHVRTRMTIVSDRGKSAATLYETKARYRSVASMVECRLETGRTHQIRVHMAAIGHPLIGDKTYGGTRGNTLTLDRVKSLPVSFPRQALHAFLIGFRHPATGQRVRLLSEIPCDIKSLINSLEQM